MVYLDTSVVVPLLAMEPSSTAVLAWFNDLGELPVSSDWLLTEFASAISMKIRTGQVSVSDARAIHKDFDMLVAGNLRLVPVNRISFKNAAEISRYHDSGLRSGDALHLAVAQEFGATMIATLDKTITKNCRRLKIGVVDFSRR